MLDSKTIAQALIQISLSENADKKIEEFFNYLREKNLMALLPAVRKHVERLSKNESDFNKLVISSKHDLSDKDIKDIKKIVEVEDVKLELVKNNDVIGGFSAVYQGHIYNGTVQNQLTQLSQLIRH